nr:cholinesterase 2-like [Cherax quadricarinatus]
MLAPKAKGLFSRAIMQSGTALAWWGTDFNHREKAEKIGQALGCPVTSDSQILLECLQKVDGRSLGAKVQDFFQWFISPVPFVPRVDGDFIPDEPAKLILEGRHHMVDLMAGVTRDDGAFTSHAMYAMRNLIRDLEANFTTVGPLSIVIKEVMDGEDVVEVTRRVYQRYLGEELNIDEDHSEALTQASVSRQFALLVRYHALQPVLSPLGQTVLVSPLSSLIPILRIIAGVVLHPQGRSHDSSTALQPDPRGTILVGSTLASHPYIEPVGNIR